MKTRMMRINDEIAKVTSEVIRSELSDPRLDVSNCVVSVINAEATSDLKTCKIRVSVLGNETAAKDAMIALEKASGFIRRRLAEIINLRQTPELKFIHDDSIEYGMKMRNLIESVNNQ